MKNSISIEVDFRAAVRQLDNIAKRQVPFAAKNALNKLAAKVIEDEQDEMRSAFDRPTPWTVNSLFVRNYATKQDLSVTIDFKDGAGERSAGKYLQTQILGGRRRDKGVEKFFVAQGLMPAGYHIIPARGFPLDENGNIPKSAFEAMVAGVKKKTHFSLLKKHGRLYPGLYYRFSTEEADNHKYGRRVRALVYYFDPQDYKTYKKRLRYFERAERSVQDHQAQIFQTELAHALATAR